ncbi:hypothetical protein AOLI_G00104810, partial [Acnodon oligacanthus]
MDPLPQERKQKKGRMVLTVLRKVLLLNRSTGAASEHEEDKTESHGTRQARNTSGTCKEEKRRHKKSLLKKALGLFIKWNRRRVEDSGRDDGAGPSLEGAPLRGDDSARNNGAGPSSEGAPPCSQTITIVHESAFDWILPGVPDEAPTQSSAEIGKKVTSAPDLHEPRPGPSQHGDVQDTTVLFSVMDDVNKRPTVFSSCEEQSKMEVNAMTPELLELKAGPKKSSSSSRKLSEVPDEVAISIDDTSRATEQTTDVPAASKSDLWWLSFSL